MGKGAAEGVFDVLLVLDPSAAAGAKEQADGTGHLIVASAVGGCGGGVAAGDGREEEGVAGIEIHAEFRVWSLSFCY